MVTADEVKVAVQAAGKHFVGGHSCSICGTHVGYVVAGDQIGFQSSCDCGAGWHDPEPLTWDDLADWVNMQTDPRGVAFARSECGLPPLEPKPSARGGS